MIKSIGIQKLETAMNDHGYRKVAEDIGVGPSILYQYCKGERDPQGMKMKTAIKLKKIYGIDFEDWTIYAGGSPILDK